ncbi:DHHC palmitoyltransferase-domain-containing protein [Zopfochytrium polystomum]|nr:DHHC palmitoyltransferase-domain-containing protein [Zopfochytrium polystomum]
MPGRSACSGTPLLLLLRMLAMNVPVVLVSALIAWSAVSFILGVCAPKWRNGYRFEAALVLTAHLLILAIYVRSYQMVVITPPGSPPSRAGLRRLTATRRSSAAADPHNDDAALLIDSHRVDDDDSSGSAFAREGATPAPGSRAGDDHFVDIDQDRDVVGGGGAIEAAVVSRPMAGGGAAHYSAAAEAMPDLVPLTLEVKRNGALRFCHKCDGLKPDRAHHCSTCGVCVLKMDHHCPWVNNCVGFRNYKFFYLFIVYTVVYCAFMFFLLLQQFLNAINAPPGQDQDLRIDLNWVMLILLSAVFGAVIFAFAGMHTVLLISNKTTIESMEGARRIRRQDNTIHVGRGANIYDLGAAANWRQVMGGDWRLWFLPVHSSEGDGQTFPINWKVYNEL